MRQQQDRGQLTDSRAVLGQSTRMLDRLLPGAFAQPTYYRISERPSGLWHYTEATPRAWAVNGFFWQVESGRRPPPPPHFQTRGKGPTCCLTFARRARAQLQLDPPTSYWVLPGADHGSA